MAEPVTVEQVLAELRSLDVEQMQSALGIVGEYDDPVIADALLEVLPSLSLDRGYGYIAAQVVGHLGALGDQRAVRPILDLLDQNLDTGDDHQLEEAGCEALVNLGAVAALPFLRAALTKWRHHEDTVAQAITAIGGASEAAFFIEALGSRRSAIAIAAAKAVATLGAVTAIPQLERLRKSKKTDVRQPALIAIARLQPDRAPELLGELLEGAKDHREKTSAISMIGHGGVVGLLPSLLAKLADPTWCDSPWLRFSILDALSALHYPEHTAMLDAIRASHDESPWCRVAATARLLVGHPELAPALLESLRTLDYSASAQDTWNWIIEANATAVDALGRAASTSPALRLRFVELMDDIRRERLNVPQAAVRDKASKVVREAVGSDMFADYDRWRAKQSA